MEAGEVNFNYAQLSDKDAERARKDLVKTKGSEREDNFAGLFDDIDASKEFVKVTNNN